MAEQINLVGNFTDNITPKLKKLDRELKSITKAFTKLGGKIRPVSREMGKLAAASERVAGSMKSQRQDITSTTQALRAYTTASRKATSQQKKLKPARMPGAPKALKGGGGAGGGAGGGMGVGAGIALGGIGMQLSTLVTSGILKGFEIGVGLLQKPFQFLADGIGERIEDEMSDIKAAGGIYAIAKRMDNPFVKSFAEAESLTKETNRYLAELAGALPGDTQDYINVAKQISDSIGQIISNDKEGALRIGRDLAEKRGEDTSVFEGGGVAATQAAYKELTGELTKQTVLASGGSKMGAMGLPQLTERMISSDNLTVGMFRRYSAVFRDPQIMSALERNIAEINATAKSSGERYEAIQKMYEEVVTPEYVRRVQRSTQGVMEALKTTFMNPEVGLLGLGRPIELAADSSNKLSIKFDQFGRMLNAQNEVVTDAADAARESLSLFEYLRDIFANVMIVLQPLIDSITSLFDPFKTLGLELDKIRNATMKFQNVYELANASLDKVIQGLPEAAQGTMKATKGMRASLMAVTSAFKEFGVFTDKKATEMYETLMSPSTTAKELQGMVKEFIDLFLNSAAGAKVGGSLGTIFGSIIATFADLLTGLFGDATLQNEFVKGFVKGFNDAGGKKAIKDIFRLVFDKLKDLIFDAVTTFPAETALLGGLALGPMLLPAIPGIISSLVSAMSGGGIGTAIAGGFSAILASPALLAAIIAGLAITAKATEEPRKALLGTGTDTGLAGAAQARTNAVRGEDGQLRSLQGNGLAGIADGLMGELTWVIHDFVKGFGDIFTGLYNIVVGAFTDPALVTKGIEQIFIGLFSLFTMVGHLIIAIGYAVPGLIMGILIVLKNLFMGIIGSIGNLLYMAVGGEAGWGAQLMESVSGFFARLTQTITNAATAVGTWGAQLGTSVSNFFSDMMGQITSAASAAAGWGAKLASSVGNFFRNLVNKIPGVNIGAPTDAEPQYNGGGAGKMSLGSAIATENKNKPAGSHLVIANSSETVIPAYKGYSPGQMARPAFGGYGGGSTTVTNNFTINGGGMNPQEIAEQVATIVMNSVEEASYSEIYTS